MNILVILISLVLSCFQYSSSITLRMDCRDRIRHCNFSNMCHARETKEDCPVTCGLCKDVKNTWQHLHNILEHPFENRYRGRGERNYAYLLENEDVQLSPNVNKVIITRVPNIIKRINPRILSKPTGRPLPKFDLVAEESIKLLVDFLKDARDGKELLKYAVNLKDHINEDIFVKALQQTLKQPKFQVDDIRYLKINLRAAGENEKGPYSVHRDGLDKRIHKQERVEVLLHARHETYPKHFIKKTTLSTPPRAAGPDECRKEANVSRGCACEKWPAFHAKKGKTEWKVSYWIEDREINNFHYRWHEYNTRVDKELGINCDDPDYHHGELFGYFHQQILARFDMERLSVGLTRVKALEGWVDNRDYRVPEPYHGDIPDVAERCENQRVTWDMVYNLSRNYDFLLEAIKNKELHHNSWGSTTLRGIQGYSHLFSVLEMDLKCRKWDRYEYGSIHNDGHNELARLSCRDRPNGRNDNRGPMDYNDVALRDPVFWRWHKLIDDIGQLYADSLKPYSFHELNLPGVDLEDFYVQDISEEKNKLQTYRSYIETNFTLEGDEFCVAQPELNHDPFDYGISIRNTGAPRKVNIRIYIAPVHDENQEEIPFDKQRNLWALMDRFSFNLRPGSNRIKRPSCHSTVTMFKPLTKEEIQKIGEEIKAQREKKKIFKGRQVKVPSPRNLQGLIHRTWKPRTWWENAREPLPYHAECVDWGRWCRNYKHFCHDPLYPYYQYIRYHCRRTCGLCSSGAPRPNPQPNVCEDEYSREVCYNNRQACHDRNHPYYKKRIYCRRTCGLCTTDPQLIVCEDEYSREVCYNNRQACHDRNHPYYKKRIYCRSTCGLCTTGICEGGCGKGTCLPNGGCRCPVGFAGKNCEDFVLVNQRKIIEVDKVCKDEDENCEDQIRNDPNFCYGELSSTGRFNAESCKRSCRLCSTECRDILRESDCRTFRNQGKCEKDYRVQQNCPKTCFNCRGVKDIIPCQCGLPHHLLVPRGTEKGMAFKLFILITPFYEPEEDIDCTEDDCSVLCAMHQQKCLGYKQGEAMAFPFDRKMKRVNGRKIRRIEDLCSILTNAKVQEIIIKHNDKVKNDQRCT